MLRFILRFLGFWVLAAAFVTLVIDGARSVASGALLMTSLGELWASLDRGSLNLSQAVVQRYVHPYLWDPIIQWILLRPAWVIFAVLGLLLLTLGKKRRSIIEA